MKLTRTPLLTLGALVLLAVQTAVAAPVAAPDNGDIFLGVRASGGQGSGVSLLVNVGDDTTFRNATAGSAVPLANVGTELETAFGANWNSRSDLTWGFFGARNRTNPAVYGSRAQEPVGRPAVSFPAQDLTQRVSTKNQIVSVTDAYSQLDQFNGDANTALQTNALNSGSYNNQVGSAGTSDFGSLSQWTSIEGDFSAGTSGTVLDFFRYAGSTTVPETEKLGSFEIASSGALTFTKALAAGVAGIKLASAAYAVDEDAGTVALTFRRTNDVSTAASATFSTEDGTAVAGTDYTAQTAVTVSFAVDEFTKTVTIPITDRAGISPERAFTVTLADPSVGALLQEPIQATVTIADTDSAVAFGAATTQVRALDGLNQPNVVELSVTRSGSLGEAASVDATISGGSLVNGTHFTFTSPTTINFAADDATETVGIPLESIPANALPGEFTVTLVNPQGTSLGAAASITVNVLPNSGEIAFTSAAFSGAAVNGAGNPNAITVNLTRTNGTVGAASATVAVTGGTLVSGTHYAALADPTVVTFAHGSSTASFDIQLQAIPANVLNGSATIVLGLSDPTNSATLGAQISATVTVVGTPGALSFSLANYTVLEEAGTFQLPIVRTGGSTGAVAVTVGITNGSATSGGDFTAPANLTVNFADGVNGASLPITILNTVNNEPNETFTVTLTTPTGGAALGTTTSATVRILDADKAGPVVTLTAPKANEKVPQSAGASVNVIGTVTDNKAVERIELQLNGGAFVNVPFTVDAKGKASFTFPITAVRGTNIVNARSLDARGNVSAVVSRAFIFDDPFGALAGSYAGLVRASGLTAPSHSNNGLIGIELKNTGSFTGKLTIDGLALSFTGVIGANGVARFGATGLDKVRVERPNKPAYEVAFTLDLTPNVARNKITGTVTQYQRTTVTANATLEADRRGFDGKTDATSVPADYLVNKGAYTVVFPRQAPQAGFTTADYPQGDGVATATVKADGTVSFAGTLADGTKLTASGVVWKDLKLPLYVELYAKGGSLSGFITFNKDATDSDFKSEELLWFRPYQNVQHYPYGWPEGLTTAVFGARYLTPADASALPGPLAAADAALGNAELEFTGGLLTGNVTKAVNIDSKDKATNAPASDKSFSLTITRASGLFSGKFTHTDDTQPAFNGAIYQKGPQKGGYGWFLSTSPKVRDGTGEAGAVTLTKNP